MSNLALFNATITNPRTQDYLVSVLGEKKSSFVNNLTALVSNSRQLQECDPVSVMYAGIKATALDLPLDQNLGFAYVIPFKNNRDNKTEAQFQIGYKGFIQLAMRSGQFKTINVRDVREGEVISEDFVSGEITFRKLETNRESAKTIGYVAYFKLINGFEKMSYWTSEEIEMHGKRYSQTYASKKDYIRDSSKWTTDFDAMAKKTVIKLLLSKYAPLSIEMQNAISSDQAVITEKGTVYIDDSEMPETNKKIVEIFENALNENDSMQGQQISEAVIDNSTYNNELTLL